MLLRRRPELVVERDSSPDDSVVDYRAARLVDHVDRIADVNRDAVSESLCTSDPHSPESDFG